MEQVAKAAPVPVAGIAKLRSSPHASGPGPVLKSGRGALEQSAVFTPACGARPMPTPIGRVFAVTAVRGHIATGESGGRIAALALAAARAGNQLYDFAPAAWNASTSARFLATKAV